jgi:hypothetical protein
MTPGLATPLAFCGKDDGRLFLITNWHVVTGRDANTLNPLDIKKGGLPNHVRFPMKREQRDLSGELIYRCATATSHCGLLTQNMGRASMS